MTIVLQLHTPLLSNFSVECRYRKRHYRYYGITAIMHYACMLLSDVNSFHASKDVHCMPHFLEKKDAKISAAQSCQEAYYRFSICQNYDALSGFTFFE